MAVGDYVGLQVHGRYQMQNIVNVFHYKILEQVADEHDVLDSLCTAWIAQIQAGWLARHVASYSLMGLKGFNKSGVNKRPGISHIDDPGTITADNSPSPMCRVITLYTDSENYRRRGRCMLSGSADTMFNITDGAVTDTELTALAVLGTLLIDDLAIAGDSFQPGLLPTDVLPWERYTDLLSRRTPACIRSRRVRGFAIG